MIDLKEMRKMTGLKQADFASRYHIPLQTLKQWESSPDSKAYRKPPEYVSYLLEQTIMRELTDHMVATFLRTQKTKRKDNKAEQLREAAQSVWG